MSFPLLALLLLAPPGIAQQTAGSPAELSNPEPVADVSTASARPLPEIATLMRAVEAHQRQDEAMLKNYTFRQMQTFDEPDGHGGLKKHEVLGYDVFWLRGVPVRKQILKNGRPLSPEELRKEDERIDNEVEKALKRRERNDSKGEQTDPQGHDEVTVARVLELGTFSNARRVQIAGRDTIAADYTGDPRARTRNRAEEMVHDLTGTVWIDEADKEVVRVEGRFAHSFKIGGGLVANIHEGTTFGMRQAKINGEVWLPTEFEGQGSARFLLLVNLNGSLHVVDTDFHKFKATATLLPGVRAATEAP